MAEAKYKIGDKVKLNSGGPVMSVQTVHTYDRYSGKDGEFSGKYTASGLQEKS